jgi:hypothetical protein
VLRCQETLLYPYPMSAGAGMLLDLTARLALRNQVYLLDCGNRSNMYRVARTLRPLTNDPAAALKNIHLSRAFTCYQVLSLLNKAQFRIGVPVLILDLLCTFMDESVQVEECFFLFDKVIECIRAASHFAPVIVSAKPLLSISAPRAGLLTLLKSQSAHFWEELPAISASSDDLQTSFFDVF